MKQVPERLDFSLLGTSLFVKLTLMQRLIMVDMFCISEAFSYSLKNIILQEILIYCNLVCK